jgi:hypothetical protein
MASTSSNTTLQRPRTPSAGRLLRRVALLLCAALLLSGCAVAGLGGGGGPDGESVFESANGRFRVMMPDEREESIEKVNTPAGELETHSVAGAVSDAELFEVFYSDVPEQTGAINVDGAFEGAINKSLTAAPGMAVTYRNRTFAYGGPAMDYTLEGPERKVWARIAIVGRRIYLIQHSGPKSAAAERNYNRYIDTFEVLSKAEVEQDSSGLFR